VHRPLHSIFRSTSPTGPRHIPHANLIHAIHMPTLHQTLVIMRGRNSILAGIQPETVRGGCRMEVRRSNGRDDAIYIIWSLSAKKDQIVGAGL